MKQISNTILLLSLCSEYAAMGTLTTDAANSPVTEAPITLQLNLNPTISHRMNQLWFFAIPKTPWGLLDILQNISKYAVVSFSCVSCALLFQSSELKAAQLGGTVRGSLQGSDHQLQYIETTKSLWRSLDAAPLPASVCSSWTPWQQRHTSGS